MKHRLHFMIPVWGLEYTDYFLHLALPTLLASQNLPVVADKYDCCFYIYSFEIEKEYIEKSPIYSRLVSLMEAQFVMIDSLSAEYGQHQLTACHNHAIRKTHGAGAGLVILAPDTLYSDGTFLELSKIISKGYRAVLSRTLNVNRDSCINELLQGKEGFLLSLNPSYMVSLWRKHPHVCSEYWVEETSRFNNNYPCIFGWKAGEGGVVLKAAQIHPLYLFPETDYQLPNSSLKSASVDTVLVKNILSNGDYYIISDSDEGVQLELRPVTEESLIAFDKPNIPVVALGYNGFINIESGNLDYFKSSIYLHAEEADSTSRLAAEQQADQFVEKLLTFANFSSFDAFLEKTSTYYKEMAGSRVVCVLGDGPLAELTTVLCKRLDLRNRRTDLVSGVKAGEFVMAAIEHTVMEKIYSQLETKGFRFNEDFIFSPMIYRSFRTRYSREIALPWNLKAWIWGEDYLKLAVRSGFYGCIRLIMWKLMAILRANKRGKK